MDSVYIIPGLVFVTVLVIFLGSLFVRTPISDINTLTPPPEVGFWLDGLSNLSILSVRHDKDPTQYIAHGTDSDGPVMSLDLFLSRTVADHTSYTEHQIRGCFQETGRSWDLTLKAVELAQIDHTSLNVMGQRLKQTSKLWLVGQVKDGSWEFQGVFSDKEQAVGTCRNENYFVMLVTLDEIIPDETTVIPEAYYPRMESVS